VFTTKAGKQTGALTVEGQTACAVFDLQLASIQFHLQQNGCLCVLTEEKDEARNSGLCGSSYCSVLPISQ